MNYQLSTLPGGIRVATAEMPHMRSVSAGIWVGVGGRHEPAKWSGISHFIEHLLFKGTENRSARQISAAVEGVGGWLNAFTTEDHTCYYAKAGAAHLPRLLNVISDMLLHSKFDPAEIEREREVIREEILMYRDQPSQYVQELLSAALWGSHPLGRPLTGTSETVGAMKRQDFLKYLERHYNHRTVIVTVAGNTTHSEVLELLGTSLGNFAKGKAARSTKCDITKLRPRMVAVSLDVEQMQLALGFPSFGRRDPRRFALKVLSVLLGENMSSRLFQSLRERHGLCYSVQTSTMGFEDVGAFYFSAGLAPENLAKACRLTLREFEKIGGKTVSKKELTQAKDYSIGQIQLGLESTSNQLIWMGESILGFDRILDPTDIESSFAAVTAEEVRQLAKKFLTPGKMAAAVVGPGADKAALQAILRA